MVNNMKKILFFIENNWSFGRIHNDLIKALYPEIHCDIIDWRISYSIQDMMRFLHLYDYIVSTPHGAMVLNTSYGVPLSKIGAVAHSNSDLQHILYTHNINQDYFDKLKSYAVISPAIRTLSIAHGIRRLPKIVNVGCFNDIHVKNKSKQIVCLGYVGVINRSFKEENFDVKRGHLVSKVAEIVKLPLVHYHDLHFLSSRSMYCDFNILMFSSLTEGLPTTILESFSSGTPVIGTATGVFPELAQSGGGIVLPFEEDAYIDQAVEALNELKNNPEKYQYMVECAIEQSKKHDWSIAKHSWVDFINSLYL